jgi:hypothetical protein
MQIHTMQQRSDEWFAVRLGKLTATSFPTLANGKPDTIKDLCWNTAKERIDRVPSNGNFTNGDMQHGVDTEPFAIHEYASEEFVVPQIVGFVEYSEYFGFSPDALVGDDGGVEAKCPTDKTHKKYLKQDEPWKAYKWQIQGSLFMSERKWWDFVSYCPPHPIIIQRVTPDDECFEKIKNGMEICQKRIRDIVLAYAA